MIKFPCPACQAKLKCDPAAAGKKIKCPKCSTAVVVPHETPPEAPEVLEEVIPVVEPKKTSKVAPADGKKTSKFERPEQITKKTSKFERAEHITTKPKSKAPVTVPDDDPDEDAGARPHKKNKNKNVQQALIIGVSVASVLVVFFLVLAVVLMSKSSNNNTPVAQSNPSGMNPNFAPGVPGNAGAPGVPPGVNVPGQPFRGPGPQASGRDSAYDDWLQDLDEAKKQAMSDKKDILLLFNGSDWSPESLSLTEEVVMRPEFQQRTKDKFVLVHIDLPKRPVAMGKVKSVASNDRFRQQYSIRFVPTVLLVDGQGRPFAKLSYIPEGAAAYATRLESLRQVRTQRDDMMARVDETKGALKIQAAKDFFKFLQDREAEAPDYELVNHYISAFEDWLKQATTIDVRNDDGLVEFFFEMAWAIGLRKFRPDRPADILPHLARLDEWKKTYKFKDPNRAVTLHLLAYQVMMVMGKKDEAKRYLQEGQVYTPTDRKLMQALSNAASAFGSRGSGSGFVVAPGYVMTNHHVVKGEGKISVRLPKMESTVPAEVVAQDEELDVALLRVSNPAASKLTGLCVAGALEPARGETVAAFGFPVITVVGAGLKLTTGVISATPEAGNGNMLVLDARINPGNSGGPLCDSCGNVIGMVTAKSRSTETVDSYGMAIPAKDIAAFLRKNIKNYKDIAPAKKRLQWNDVDRIVSTSVIMVLRGDIDE